MCYALSMNTADQTLAAIRSLVALWHDEWTKIDSNWTDAETQALVFAIEELDELISDGAKLPTDWKE